MKTILLLLFGAICCWSCQNRGETEKYYNARKVLVDVHNQIKEIKVNDFLIGSIARLFIIDNYLIILDAKSQDKLVHIFNINNFDYLTSVIRRGKGPGEIVNIGHIGIDNTNRRLFVTDHGKQVIYDYELDRLLADTSYLPELKTKLGKSQFPDRYLFVNDSISLGIVIEPIGNSDYKQLVAKWNMATGEIVPMKYEHPDINKKRINFAASIENKIYVETYIYHNLMTICTLNGDLKYNVYGPTWDATPSKNIHHYGKTMICKDKIIALYSGGDNYTSDYYPTKFLVFDINGNYIKTLNTEYKIDDFCYDRENNRIVMTLNDQIQLAYFDVGDILD